MTSASLIKKQAGAELDQAQDKQHDIIEVTKALVEIVGGGWLDKTKLIVISTQIEVVAEFEVDLGNILIT